MEELLRAGINVYTTINIEHIESVTDVVASITGIPVPERIPDSVFDRADQIEFVDIAPGDFIERLQKKGGSVPMSSCNRNTGRSINRRS
ncbi:hypothetical protein ACFTAO_21240 [Paenibacillus rhizoplanae]